MILMYFSTYRILTVCLILHCSLQVLIIILDGLTRIKVFLTADCVGNATLFVP